MDPKTGQIFEVTKEEDARKKGLIPIPPEELERVNAMSPEERKAWAQRKLEAEKQLRAKQALGNRKQRRALKAKNRVASKKARAK